MESSAKRTEVITVLKFREQALRQCGDSAHRAAEGASHGGDGVGIVSGVSGHTQRFFDVVRATQEAVESQGLQANQQVTCFSDGGDTARTILEYLNPDSEHVLDWFHITMRLTVLRQCARGLARERARDAADERTLERRVESVKHYLRHGNVASALEGLDDLAIDLEVWDCDEEGDPQPQPDSAEAARLLTYVRELQTYLAINARFIVNNGERYRNGERISTGFVASTINDVVSKRMVKKQQMHWTPDGAHLLLHVRTRILNGEWEGVFRTWYPGFRPLPAAEQDTA